ncbi:MAG TPA: CsbD family protein [Acetobacteraceae bacterium]|jgi:uncharacterized protein YjbJ (UPF0337 family)|nr:CsbD family protein [Acetobacteraceae bacterium]
MDSNRIEGAAQNMAGRVQDAAGGLIGDTGMQAAGKVRAASGQVQNAAGGALDSVREFASDQPLTALVVAAGVGFLLGALARG